MAHEESLEQKTATVIGAPSGIIRAIPMELADASARVLNKARVCAARSLRTF